MDRFMDLDVSEDQESASRRDLENLLSRHVVPLFADKMGRPMLVGSGFLVSSGEHNYLISAAHVLDEASKSGLYFYAESKTIRKLSGELRLTKIPNGRDRKHDRLDVGVLKLEKPCPPYPAVEKYSLPITAFKPKALPRDGKQYLLMGFPETKSRVKTGASAVSSELYCFHGVSVSPQSYGKLGVAPETHIVLSFDKKTP